MTSDLTDDANPAFDTGRQVPLLLLGAGTSSRRSAATTSARSSPARTASTSSRCRPARRQPVRAGERRGRGEGRGQAGRRREGTSKKEKGDDKKGDKKDDKEAAKPAPVEIDLDGIGERVVALPVDAGNYGRLRAAEGKLFFLDRPALPEGGDDDEDGGGGGGALKVFLMDKREVKDVLPGVTGYDLSADGKKLLYAMGRQVRHRRRGGRPEAGREAAAHRRDEGEGRSAGRVGADVPRGLAARTRLLLRPRHARRRLGGDGPPLRAARPVRRAPRRPRVPDRRADRRAELLPHLRRRRRPAEGAARRHRTARLRLPARAGRRPLPDRRHPARARLERRPAHAARRPRHRREGGRLPARRRRRRPARAHRAPTACSRTRSTGRSS